MLFLIAFLQFITIVYINSDVYSWFECIKTHCSFCRNEFVRNIQALINQALAQSLLFALLAISLQNYYIYEMCLGLGSLVHYAITVTFMWFVFRPIILLLSLIRRNLYERECFILPFVFMAWGKAYFAGRTNNQKYVLWVKIEWIVEFIWVD